MEDSADAAIRGELERALAVDPSPEFVARVRTSVAREAPSPRWWRPRFVVVTGLALIAIAVALSLRPVPPASSRPAVVERAWSLPADAPAQPREPAARADLPGMVRERPSRARAAAPQARQPPTSRDADVVIAADEATALRRLLAAIRDGHVAPGSLPAATPLMALQAPADLTIAPIAVAPLAIEEGERQ
jgi:hypothetical protein